MGSTASDPSLTGFASLLLDLVNNHEVDAIYILVPQTGGACAISSPGMEARFEELSSSPPS